MIPVDSKLFKQVAEKFAAELSEKHCPDEKIKHSFTLEALSHAFGYKDYNTIKPKLDQIYNPIVSIAVLIENGYMDASQLNMPIEPLTQIAQRQLFKHLFLQLAYFHKNLINQPTQKYYYSIASEEHNDYENIIHAVSVCLGIKIEYFLIGATVVIYWEAGGLAFDVGPITSSLEKDTCMQIYNKGERATQCLIKGLSGKEITVKFFRSDDGSLSNNEESFNKGERFFLTYGSDREMRMASMLVNDVTNKEFGYAIFRSSFDGMIRARYVVQNHPEVAMYVLDKMYGYNSEFI